MGQRGPTVPRSHTPVLKGWGLTQQAHLPRLTATVGKNVQGFPGMDVSPVGSVGGIMIQPIVETVILNGGYLEASANCQSAMLVRHDG